MDFCLIVWATMAKKQKSIHASTLEFERRQNEISKVGRQSSKRGPIIIIIIIRKEIRPILIHLFLLLALPDPCTCSRSKEPPQGFYGWEVDAVIKESKVGNAWA